MLRYNLVIVEVPWRGGWILGAQIVRVLSQGVLAPFMHTMGTWSLWNNTYVCNWKICTKQLCAWPSNI